MKSRYYNLLYNTPKHLMRLLISLILLCVFGSVPANAYYFSSAIWYTGDTIYGRSETYIEPEEGSIAGVECWLQKPNYNYVYSSDSSLGSASATSSADKVPGYWNVRGDHFIDGNYIDSTGVDVDLTEPVIDYFYASPTRITPPGTATLYYSTHNGTTANINGTPISLTTGTLVVSPSVTTSYTLTVTNQNATKQATVTMWVNPPLNPLLYQYSVRHEKGASPFFPFLPLQGESVNSANGNLFFKIPLLSRPGRNGLGVDLTLAYNSKIWDFFVQGSTLYATVGESDSWVGAGWTLLIGRVIDDAANGHYYVTLSDGSNHDLTYYGGAWRSRDSTYMLYDPGAHKLTLKGGMNLKFDHVDELRSYARYATRIQDTSGNYIDINYADFGGRIGSIQDTLGNSYTFFLNSNGRLQYIKYWNTNDASQATSTITLNYQNQSLYFGAQASMDPNLPSQGMITQIVYPSGMRYAFTYNASGEISEITNPTCGKSRYTYATYTILDRLLGRTVPDHLVSTHDTNGADTWTWNYVLSGQPAPARVDIVLPDGGGTIAHYMQRSSPGWADGFITKTTESGNPGTESRQDWTQDDELLTTILNPRSTYKERVLKGGTQKIVRTEFEYAPTTDYSGNVKEIREYSFAGTLRRKTQLAYLHEENSAYIPLNILDRVSATLIYDGSNNLIAKNLTAYDAFAPLYAADNAIRHDSAFGPTYSTRGLPSAVTRWYDIGSNLSITSSIKYDECGNPKEITDPKSNVTFISYWLSSADNAYAFPLGVINAKGHATGTIYSYKSGAVLSQMDANGKITSMIYDEKDRVVRINRPSGGTTTYSYSDPCNCSSSPPVTPYAEIKEYISGAPGDPNAKDRTKRQTFDFMGRTLETTVEDPIGGFIKSENTYGPWSQLFQVTVPHRESASSYSTNYGYSGTSFLTSVGLAEGGSISYSYSNNQATVSNTDGRRRRYAYQEDGKISEVMEEDAGGQLTVATNYSYDALGRLLTINQGVQTRSFTYDALGRLKSETHPESGATTYTYDANSNVVTKSDARGITTSYAYDELNRVTQKSYSDATPAVSYFYDSQPPGSPIPIMNPIGRLTRVTTTSSGVTSTNYYSYCNCTSIDSEATVITDGITKTYITSYTYDYMGGLTSITYPNGKVVTYTRDDVGRETKVSSTIGGLAIDYVRSAAYLGPSGQLSQVEYGIRYQYYGSWLSTLYSYSPKTLRLTLLQTHGLREGFQYGTPENPGIQTGHIYDIVDEYNPEHNKHFEYDQWYRLTSFQVSPGRSDPYTRKLVWTYDGYNNIASVRNFNNPGNCPQEGCLDEYHVDPATNRLLSIGHNTLGFWTSAYAFDAAGNDITGGKTFDGENRLTFASGLSYIYDGNSRRLRILQGSAKTYSIYSAKGQLLVEDKWTEGTVQNQIYFNGQVVATHDQADYVRFFFKDYLGSIRSVLEVTPGGSDWTKDWQTVEIRNYDPFGGTYDTWNGGGTPYNYTGKLMDANGLQYFGARYYQGPYYSRWISADSVMGRPYDPPSLNKYTYVRNDPVNKLDPDGRSWISAFGAFMRSVVDAMGNDDLRPWDPYNGMPSDIGGGTGGGGDPLGDPGLGSSGGEIPQTPQSLMKPENLAPALRARIGTEIFLLDGSKQKPCELFLQSLLKAANLSIGINEFVNIASNVKYGGDKPASRGTVNGYTDPNTWTASVYFPAFSPFRLSNVAGQSGDYLSTTLHEAFHVASHVRDGIEFNSIIGAAIHSPSFSGTRVAPETELFFNRYCGQNPKSFP